VIPKDWVTERFTQAQLNADPKLQDGLAGLSAGRPVAGAYHS
jgi:hypothetical protein